MSSVAITVRSPPSVALSGAAVGAVNSAGIPVSPPPLTSSLSSPPPHADTVTASAATIPITISHRSFDRIVLPFGWDEFWSSGSFRSASFLPGIECVLHRVAHEVEREDRQQEGDAGEDHVPPGVA